MLGLAILCVANVLSQLSRAVIAVIAPELSRDLALGPQALANLSGTLFLAFALAQIPIGVMLDRYGPRRTCGVLLVIASIGLFLIATSQTLAVAMVGQACLGVGLGAVQMSGFVVVARFIPASRFGVWAAVVIASGQVGTLVAAAPFARLADALGWRGGLLVLSGAAIATATAVAFFVRDRPAGEPASTAPRESIGAAFRGVATVIKLRALWPMIPIAFAGYATLIVVRGLWAGPWLHEVHGLDTVARGDALIAMSVAIVVGCLGYGWLERATGRPKHVTIAGTAIGIAALSALAVAPTMPLANANLALVLLGLAGFSMVTVFAHARRFLPDALVGRGVTFLNIMPIAGAWLLQSLSGSLMAASAAAGLEVAVRYQALFGALALILALAIIPYLGARADPAGEKQSVSG